MANSNVAIMTSVVLSSVIIKRGFNHVGKLFWNRNKRKFIAKTRNNVRKIKRKIQQFKNKFMTKPFITKIYK